MENTSYYLKSERLVFLTEEDARDYFFKEEIYHSVSLYFSLNDFLKEQDFDYEEIFLFEKEDKANVLADYQEALFERWLSDGEEVVACDIYE